MFDESITNIANIVLAGGVIYFAYAAMAKAPKALNALLTAVMLSGVVIGVAEIVDWLQIFPDGTIMSDLIYEKEILISILLIWGVMGLKKSK